MSSIFMFLSYALTVYQFILFGRVLLTWLPNMDPRNPIVRFLYAATEPVLEPIRRLLPAGAGLDFSPLIVFIVIAVFNQLLGRMF